MGGVPSHIYNQLKLGKRNPVQVETTPILEEHQTTIKLPQKIRAELDLEKGDKISLLVESPTRIIFDVIKAKK